MTRTQLKAIFVTIAAIVWVALTDGRGPWWLTFVAGCILSTLICSGVDTWWEARR